MIGAIIGDIAGSVYEFMGLKNKNLNLFTSKSFFTDDTVMSCAIAKSLIECNGDYSNLGEITINNMHEIGPLYYKTAGYGGRFYNWLVTGDKRPYYSFGNGSAMRIGAIPYFSNSLEMVKELTKKVTEITHNHPEGLKGAEATAVTIWLALNGYKKKEIKQYIEENYYSLKFKERDLFKNYKFNETCQETVPQCIFAFLISKSYEDAIRKVISWGGDTDTMGAITGAMAEAFYGIPEDIKEIGLSYLDDRMLEIVNNFNNAIQIKKNNNQ